MDNIILLILPPHTSHLTQPLDVGIFSPLKKVMATEMTPLISTGISRILKVEWLTAFVQAHNKVFNNENIARSFHGPGIFPLDPTKVLDRIVQRPSTSELETREITPPVINPFNSVV
jgi:hypothetical protein